MKHFVRVTFDDGDTIETSINGTEAEVRAYYAVGRVFNICDGTDDNMRTVVSIKFLD